MNLGSERRLQFNSDGNISADGASTGATGGEVLVFIFWLLLIPLI
jgi:hypothetical protein